MPIQLLNENVLSIEADALLLTIDGQTKGLGGSVAHAFIRQWPVAYEVFESRLGFPVPLGRAVAVTDRADCPWDTIIFLTTLNHVQTLHDDEKSDVVATAFADALSMASSAGIRSIATVVLRGGWRLSMQSAFLQMVSSYERSSFVQLGRTLKICNFIASEYDSLNELLKHHIDTESSAQT